MFLYYGTVILSNVLLLTAFIIGILKRKYLPQDGLWLLTYLGFVLGVELITKSMILFYAPNINIVFPFYISGEFLLMSGIFTTALKWSRWRFYAFVAISFFIFIEGITLWWSAKEVTSGYGKICSHLIIIFFSGYLLIKGIREFKSFNPILPVYGGLFLYFSCSLFLFLLLNQLTDINPQNASVLWAINNLLSCILYSITIYVFLRLKK